MILEGSLSCLEEPSTCPYQMNPVRYNLLHCFSKINFNIILPSTTLINIS